MTPLVSICLPCLNGMRFLEPRMDSIVSQTFGDWELVICDNYSDDGSWEFFHKFRNDHRVSLHRVKRLHFYTPWNRCVELSNGEYIYFATADDTCDVHLLERLLNGIERARKHLAGAGGDPQQVRLASCDFDFIDDCGKVMNPPPTTVPARFYSEFENEYHIRSGLLEFIVHLCVGVSWTTMTAVLIQRSLFGMTGLFRTDIGAFGDRCWAVKSACHSDTVHVPGKLATWRWHEGQGSKKVNTGLRKRIVQAVRETVQQCEQLLPDNWKQDSRWCERLLTPLLYEYLRSYNLDRHTAKNNAGSFISGIVNAGIHEPRLLAQRLLDGFRWTDMACTDEATYAASLVRDWKVSWPPTEL